MPAPRVLVVAALILVGATAACSSSATNATATTTTAAVTTTAPPTTPPATTTTTPGSPTVFFPDRAGVIDHLIAAWQANDQAAARQGATAEAVHNLFTQSANGYALYGCDSGEFRTSNCNWRDRATGGYAQITAQKQPKGWIVIGVYMDTDG